VSVGARSESSLDIAAPLKDRWIRYWPWPFGKQEKVEIAERIAASDEGVRLRAEAMDEAKRLLYVTMTRARDFLIVALPAKARSRFVFRKITPFRTSGNLSIRRTPSRRRLNRTARCSGSSTRTAARIDCRRSCLPRRRRPSRAKSSKLSRSARG
jgi:hypothetical protein